MELAQLANNTSLGLYREGEACRIVLHQAVVSYGLRILLYVYISLEL